MRNIYWVAPLIVVLALGAAFVIWHQSRFTPTPPIQSPLPESPTATKQLTYYCDDNKTIQATFKAAELELALSDNRTFDLPQVVSGSGIKYEMNPTKYGTDVAFIGKGDNAFLLENDKTTFANCTAATVLASDAPGYATYTDVGRTFTFAFPTNFSITGSAIGFAPGWSALTAVSGMVLAKLTVPQSFQSGTNFNEATFIVGTSADPDAVANCTKAENGAAATPTKLGDMEVTMLTAHDAAAGNRYDTTSYRVVHNAQCYAVEYTIHYGAIENYPKGAVKEFNEEFVAHALDEVAKSFSFIK
jgi:membrane-bound inhibitor of C-type lysozyme